MEQESRKRTACENCHERKTRCIILGEGDSCLACQQSGWPCFFMPRFKSGRPRRSSTDSRRPGIMRQQTPAQQRNPQTPRPKRGDSQPDLGLTSEQRYQNEEPGKPFAAWDREGSHQAFGIANMDLDNFHDITAAPETFHPDYVSAPQPGLYDDQSETYIDLATLDADPTIDQMSALMGDLSPRSGLAVDHMSALLESLTQLHQHAETLKCESYSASAVRQPRGKLIQVLSVISMVCTQALEVAGIPAVYPHDSALTSLALAAMGKVFALCGSIIAAGEQQFNQRASSNPSSTSGKGAINGDGQGINVDFIIILKQLDLNLTQARMCLFNFSKQRENQAFITAMDQSTALQQRISGLINRLFA